MKKTEPSVLAYVIGCALGIAITYATVLLGVVSFGWLADSLGLAGAITVDIIVWLNVYTLLLDRP